MGTVFKMAARDAGRRWTREQRTAAPPLSALLAPPSSVALIPASFGSVCHLLKNLEVRLLLSPLPPLLQLHRPLGIVETFLKMFIMSYHCPFHLLLTPGGLAPLQGLEVRRTMPGKVRNVASLFL